MRRVLDIKHLKHFYTFYIQYSKHLIIFCISNILYIFLYYVQIECFRTFKFSDHEQTSAV